jgi:UDP-glucose 4-epimerase
LDKELINESIKESDGCIHLAAALGVKQILENPLESLTTNVHGSENVISACALREKPLFLASTSEVYGKNDLQPLDEGSDRVIGSPQILRWAYSEAKAIDETIAEMYRLSHGLNYVIGRLFNTVGPRQTGMYGMVLPRFVQSALRDEALTVYGDGTQTRVFCHVNDAVSAIILMHDNQDCFGETFNIGGEGEISILELAKKVIELLQSKSKVVHLPYSTVYPVGFEDMMRRVPNTTKLRNYINWKPTLSLSEIIYDIRDNLESK